MGITICTWQSPFAYRDEADVVSPCAYGDCRMHMKIPICIWEFVPEEG
jgi:hypothetical protein